MKPLHVAVSLFIAGNTVVAQPVLTEPPDFPQTQPGPQADYSGSECFLLAEGVIFPGDVDWIRIRMPRASTRTVIDVDFSSSTSGSALLALVTNGTTGFNAADNNNSRDALCGLNGVSSPVGSPRDSAVDLRATLVNATIHIGITGTADLSFAGMHTENFAYQVWVYALPIPCVDDAGCSDGVGCTVDQCDVATGDCILTVSDEACDDDFYCNGTEWCDSVLGCRTTGPPACVDTVDCTFDYCDFSMDQCAHDPSNELCDNGMFCDGEEICDAQAGCQAGPPVDCSDDMPCTVDACDEENWECLHTVANDACDDGLFCNGVEQCDFETGCSTGSPACSGSLCRESDDRCVECLSDGDCDDSIFCNGDERCNSLGVCVSGGYPCGAAMCRESDDRCVDCLADADCMDGVFCNGSEFCGTAGSCEQGAPPCGQGLCRESDDRCVDCLANSDCDDSMFCDGAESCNSAGACVDGGYPCGAAMCRESDSLCVECLSDADCDDAVFCNGPEACDSSGACVAGSDSCPGAQCRETDDQCVECLADADCDDGLFCNGDEFCHSSGMCAAGAQPCVAGEACDELADECVSAGFSIDVRPGVCPAKVMTNGRGQLPVALIGAKVRLVDFASVRVSRADGVGTPVRPMLGPSGPAPRFGDVSSPSEACTCPGGAPDGLEDLTLPFDLEAVVQSLRLATVRNGGRVELRLTGRLRDGTPFDAVDCVTIQSPGRNGTGAAQ